VLFLFKFFLFAVCSLHSFTQSTRKRRADRVRVLHVSAGSMHVSDQPVPESTRSGTDQTFCDASIYSNGQVCEEEQREGSLARPEWCVFVGTRALSVLIIYVPGSNPSEGSSRGMRGTPGPSVLVPPPGSLLALQPRLDLFFSPSHLSIADAVSPAWPR
jgi:hypothetical protein